MNARIYHRLFPVLIAFVITGVLAGCFAEQAQSGATPAGAGATLPADQSPAAAAQAEVTPTVYLPTIVNGTGKPPTFGVEASTLAESQVLARAVDAGVYWVRRGSLFWSVVQPSSPADWQWKEAAGLEGEMIQASANGLKLILVVRSTPAWAQQVPGYSCGPIKPEALPAFTSFMAEVVKRYSAPPYNVQYYEIWNEPDVEPAKVVPDSPYGCWGDPVDPDYGGGAYGQMLKAVYPAMKAANPSAQVLLGGLLLDCDPANIVEGGCATEAEKKPPRFVEGAFAECGNACFDIISFHGYSYFNEKTVSPIHEERDVKEWKARGGTVEGKLDYLRELMARYGVDKPIFHSEAGLLYMGGDPARYEELKAEYLAWLYLRNWAGGLMGTSWYTLNGPGWREAGLLDGSQNPRPAYQALQVLTQALSSATFKSADRGTPGVEMFDFRRGGRILRAVFSTDGATHSIPAPANLISIHDIYGNPVPLPGGTITFQQPLYLELGS